MNLQEIKNKYSNSELTKNEYIDSMYQQHSLLFEYSAYIKNTNLDSIEIKDDLVIAKFRDSQIRFICIPGDKRLAPLDTLNFGEYERDELEMQYRLIPHSATIIDIGANLGWYSMHVAKYHPQSTVHALEPIPRTYDFLNKNIEINNIKNIIVHPVGLSDQKGELDLYFDPLLSVNASLQNVSESRNVQKVTCKIDTLDDFCISNNIKQVDFIKCDVEGAEFFALRGGRKVISASQPIIFCEMLRKWSKKFNYHPNDIINFMSELNYVCLVIRDKYLEHIESVNDETQDTNFIFLHSSKHKQQLIDFVK